MPGVGKRRCTGAASIVRLPDASSTGVKKALDAGALGVLIPNIKTGEDVRAVVAAARFYPKGERGACPMVRAARQGVTPWADYVAWAAVNTQVWVNIETVEAVENIDAVLDAVSTSSSWASSTCRWRWA